MEFLLSQGMSLKAYKMYITATFTHLIVKLYKNKNLRCSFIATADAAVKAKYTAFVVCQSYRRGIFRMVLKLSLHHR